MLRIKLRSGSSRRGRCRRNLIQPLATGLMPSLVHPIDSKICAFSTRSWAPSPAIRARASSGSQRHLDQRPVKKLRDANAPYRSYGPESRDMRSDRIAHWICWRTAIDACEKGQSTLLIGELGRYEQHVAHS
jgi:hypothetical protein